MSQVDRDELDTLLGPPQTPPVAEVARAHGSIAAPWQGRRVGGWRGHGGRAPVPDLPDLSGLPALPTAAVRRWSRVARRVLRWRWDVVVHGLAQLPQRGPVILASNHLGVLDGPLLVAVTPRPAYALAKQELFAGVLGRFLERTGQIPVDRRRVDARAIRRCLQVLVAGETLAIFPEGVRGAGDFTHAERGAAYLALVTGAPVVPVAVLGTREPGHSTRTLPGRRRPIHVVYGAPIRVPQRPWPRRQAEVATVTEELRRALAAHVAGAQRETGLGLPGPPA